MGFMNRGSVDEFAYFVFMSFAALVVAVVLGSVLNAIWLGIASKWLRIGALTFRKSFVTVFLCNFVFSALGYSSILSLAFFSVMPRQGYRDYGFDYQLLTLFTPVGFTFVTVATIIGHALLFCNRLSEADGTPLPFMRACTLAFVYLGICSAFASGIWLIIALGLTSANS